MNYHLTQFNPPSSPSTICSVCTKVCVWTATTPYPRSHFIRVIFHFLLSFTVLIKFVNSTGEVIHGAVSHDAWANSKGEWPFDPIWPSFVFLDHCRIPKVVTEQNNYVRPLMNLWMMTTGSGLRGSHTTQSYHVMNIYIHCRTGYIVDIDNDRLLLHIPRRTSLHPKAKWLKRRRKNISHDWHHRIPRLNPE